MTRGDKGKNFEWYGTIKKHYNLFADTYDYEHSQRDTPFGYIEKRRRDCVFLITKQKGKMLDTACGTGYYIERLQENECFGMDISKKMTQRCKEKNLNNICIGTYENIPYKDYCFDVILCISAFQHSQNPQKTLNEMSRVLKRNGEIILTFSNWTSFRSIIHLLRKLYGRRSYERRYTVFTLKKMFEVAGLKIDESYGFNFLPYKSHHRSVNPTVLKLFGSFEKRIENTPFKYFGGEVVIRLIRIE